jgi:hypothetical protein
MAKKNVPQEGPNVLKYGKRRTQEAERLAHMNVYESIQELRGQGYGKRRKN